MAGRMPERWTMLGELSIFASIWINCSMLCWMTDAISWDTRVSNQNHHSRVYFGALYSRCLLSAWSIIDNFEWRAGYTWVHANGTQYRSWAIQYRFDYYFSVRNSECFRWIWRVHWKNAHRRHHQYSWKTSSPVGACPPNNLNACDLFSPQWII